MYDVVCTPYRACISLGLRGLTGQPREAVAVPSGEDPTGGSETECTGLPATAQSRSYEARVEGEEGSAGGVPGFGGSAGRGSGVRTLGKEARERGMTFLPSVLRRALGVAGSRHGQAYIYAMLAQPDPAHSPISLRALSHTPPPPR